VRPGGSLPGVRLHHNPVVRRLLYSTERQTDRQTEESEQDKKLTIFVCARVCVCVPRLLPLWGESMSPMVRPMRLGLCTLARWRYCMGLDMLVMLGASGLYISVSYESGGEDQGTRVN